MSDNGNSKQVYTATAEAVMKEIHPGRRGRAGQGGDREVSRSIGSKRDDGRVDFLRSAGRVRNRGQVLGRSRRGYSSVGQRWGR